MLEKLYNLNLFAIKLGLKNIQRLNMLLDDPAHAYPTIHIAGTNGKGSVAAKIAKGLQNASFKVGLFTSPHISSFCERIKINDTLISEASLSTHLKHIFALIEEHSIPATFFEVTTALALTYFAKQKVDVAVIETGLGGRLDATNIITPKVAVITSISLDHTEILGKTIEEITKEKAGIIKPGTPTVVGPTVPLKTPHQIKGTFATFEEENNAVAKKALQLYGISDPQIEGAHLPCRFEVHVGPPKVILDVAHNPEALRRLFAQVPESSIRCVCAFSKTKDLNSCLSILKKHILDLHLTQALTEQTYSANDLYQAALQIGFSKEHLFPDKDLEQNINLAFSEAKKNRQTLVICGSFYIMDAACAKISKGP